jgi:hypothetical protein
VSTALKFRMGHGSLIAFAIFCSRYPSFVSVRSAWVAGSRVFNRFTPCFSAELDVRTYNVPSVLLQYRRPFGVLSVV